MFVSNCWYMFVWFFVNVNLSTYADNVSCFERADRQWLDQRLATKTPYRFVRPVDSYDGELISEPYEGIFVWWRNCLSSDT